MQSERKLVPALVQFMDNSSPKLQCQALVTLGYLTKERESQLPRPRISYSSPTAAGRVLGIVETDGLKSLLRLLQSQDLDLISSAASCIRNVTLRPEYDSTIIEAGFLQPLVNLMGFKDNKTIQYYAAEALGNLAESTECNKLAIGNAGAVHLIQELIVELLPDVQVEMAHCIRGLSHSGMHSPSNHLL